MTTSQETETSVNDEQTTTTSHTCLDFWNRESSGETFETSSKVPDDFFCGSLRSPRVDQRLASLAASLPAARSARREFTSSSLHSPEIDQRHAKITRFFTTEIVPGTLAKSRI